MTHVTKSAPSTDLQPQSVEFSPLEPQEIPPGPLRQNLNELNSFALGVGYLSGYLLDSETQKTGFLVQGVYHDWFKAQILDSNILGLQFGISIMNQKFFIGSYLLGSDQLANFVDYKRFKFILNFNLLPRDTYNSPWRLNLDIGYGYLGYIVGLIALWSF
ncbi:MAG TPA: hypothetical protein PLJ21_00655 [Pseudobdellovibrionaceae bacterium]|nr:hypothetical protein [Pseudobdellovibrionaceae bacterium]